MTTTNPTAAPIDTTTHTASLGWKRDAFQSYYGPSVPETAGAWEYKSFLENGALLNRTILCDDAGAPLTEDATQAQRWAAVLRVYPNDAHLVPKVTDTAHAAATAQAILDQAAALGWTVGVQDAVLSITKRFNAGSIAGYEKADKEYPCILALAMRTGYGGDWGDTGRSMRATRLGLFVMNRGGVSGPVLEAIAARVGTGA